MRIVPTPNTRSGDQRSSTRDTFDVMPCLGILDIAQTYRPPGPVTGLVLLYLPHLGRLQARKRKFQMNKELVDMQ
jgi:hypothetical protein